VKAIDGTTAVGAAQLWGWAADSQQKGAPSVWEQEFLDELCAYIGFTQAHAAALRDVGPSIRPAFDGIVDRFYEAVTRNARARSVYN
jgi:hypothetical protein